MLSPSLTKSPWLPLVAFCLLIGPFALSFHMHYPDEMYYTDAAVSMMQTGDLHTTYLGDGNLRFKKPILTYWAVLAGFKIFGITPAASRLLFLLAGAGIIGLVYRISRLIFPEKKEIAHVAAWIIASQPILILSATRSIPDILLALFITLAGWGFAGVLTYGNDCHKKYWWGLYLGLALAFETKGVPALALGGIGLLYLLFNPWQRIQWGKMLYFPALAVAAFVALYWFVQMYLIHGAVYLNSFVEDQVGMRVTSRFFLIGKNFAVAVLLMVAFFLPWIAFVRRGIQKRWTELSSEKKAFLDFTLLWAIAIIVMSAFVSKFYERYLLPVIPVVAIGVAWWIGSLPSFKEYRGATIATCIFLVLAVLAWVLGVYLTIGLGAMSLFVGVKVVASLLLLSLLMTALLKKEDKISLLGMSILLVFFNYTIITNAISLPDAGQQASMYIEEKNQPVNTRIGFVGHLHTASKIRIGLGANIFMQNLDTKRENFSDATPFDAFIVEDRYLDKFSQENYHNKVLATNWDAKKLPEIIRGIYSGEDFTSYTKRYYWVEKISVEQAKD